MLTRIGQHLIPFVGIGLPIAKIVAEPGNDLLKLFFAPPTLLNARLIGEESDPQEKHEVESDPKQPCPHTPPLPSLVVVKPKRHC